MKKIYCFMERQGEAFERFVETYDADNILNLYDDVLQSTQGEVTCYINEISRICETEDGILWFVTDVKVLYELVERIFPKYFEKLILLGSDETTSCEVEFDVYAHMDYELSLQDDGTIRNLLNRICELRMQTKMDAFIYFSIELLESIEKKQNALWWSHICLSLLEIDELKKQESWEYRCFLLSVVMQTVPEASRTNAFLENVVQSSACTKENAYFIWNQFKGFSLFNLVERDRETSALLDTLYRRSYSEYLSEYQEIMQRIPYQSRNHDWVVVFTIQLLEKGHSPTKTTLERVKTLCKLGKKVMLINTTEQYLGLGYLPCYNPRVGTIRQELDEADTIHIEDLVVPFMQLPSNMLLGTRLEFLVQLLSKIRPEYILSIGTGSMLADLCGNVVPCASMALAFSTLPHTMNQMRILGRQLDDHEKKRMNDVDIIESRFTFELKPQKVTLTREGLHLPEDRFLLAVIGIRLDSEVDDAFLDMLDHVCKNGCYVVFAGRMSKYSQVMESHVATKDNSTFIGYQDDILALMEIADLYVNPKRLGEGFSVIEAFYKGKPGVYLRTGDVYVAGGEEFAVSDYDDMSEEIIHYKEDKVYYEKRAGEAVRRADLMTDSVSAIQEIDEAICKRVRERYW